MKPIFFFIALSFISNISFANNLTHFKDRFAYEVNSAGEKVIIDKNILENVSADVYIKNIATYLMNPTAMNTVFTCKGYTYEKPDLNVDKTVQDALNWMRKSNVGKLLVDPQFLKLMRQVEATVQSFTADPQYSIVANLNNPTFFYKNAFSQFMKKKIADLVGSYLGSNPLLSVAKFIANDYADLVGQKKLYDQNILSYYLETTSASELGLTEVERKRAFSSIEDSKLSFSVGGYWDSAAIAKDFDNYGYNKLLKADKSGEARWAANEKLFDSRLEKISVAFSDVSYESSPMTIDVVVKHDKLDNRPSLTFDEQCPDFVFSQRQQWELYRIALGVSPIPFTGYVEGLIKAKYQKQALAEGMYYAHLESLNQDAKKALIMKQSMNPLLNY